MAMAADDEETTKAVFEHHLNAFAAGDIEALLADYTDESVIMSAAGSVRGLEGMRAGFEELLHDLFKPGTYRMTVDSQQIERDVAYIVFHADCATATVPLGTDTFVVRDGKIAVQTFSAKIDPK
jgi:ketosteroid isomerase-like protein